MKDNKNVNGYPVNCPKCGKLLKMRKGKYGDFLGCTGFPECRYTFDLSGFTNIKCPNCGKRLVVKYGKGKNFLGCTGYPKCDYIFDLIGNVILCPKCKKS